MPLNFVVRCAIHLVHGGLLLLCFILLHFFIPSLQAQTVQDNLYVTNGDVYASTISGNTLYIGGDFTLVGPFTDHGAALDASTGLPDLSMPRVHGVIRAVTPDGQGGWYIGGTFTSVGGVPRNNLAHIKPDKTLDANWNPNPYSPYRHGISTLVISGSVVYVGGDFSYIGGQPRNNIAALDASTGNATAWNPNANWWVYTIAVSGSVIYVGGDFDIIGGQVRYGIAALEKSTGFATAWNPSAIGGVLTLAVSDSLVYAGGDSETLAANQETTLQH